MSDILGLKFGLVTITQRSMVVTDRPWFGVCECGRGRWFKASNLKRSPPKTHGVCYRAAPAMPFDNVQ